MKKNKDNFVIKQRNKLIAYNISAISLVFFALGFLVVILITSKFYDSADNELERAKSAFLTIVGDKRFPSTDQEALLQYLPENPRISIFFYDGGCELIAKKAAEGLAAQISGIEGEPKEEICTAKYDKYNYRRLIFRLQDNEVEHETIDTVMILINIDGEMELRNSIVSIYLMCMLGLVGFVILAAILISKYSLKPVESFIEKQTRFVADASHELRTPLAVINANLCDLLGKSSETIMSQSEQISLSLAEVQRLSKMTNSLLTLARGDSGAQQLEVSRFELKTLLEEVCEPYAEISEMQGKEFSLISDEAFVRLDRNLLKQLMIILLDNAIKFTAPAEKITIISKTVGNKVYIECADTGIGISDEAMDHIFDRFYCEDKARSKELGGNGLGLSIAKWIVSIHDGKIKVDHNQPKGTRFSVILPTEIVE